MCNIIDVVVQFINMFVIKIVSYNVFCILCNKWFSKKTLQLVSQVIFFIYWVFLMPDHDGYLRIGGFVHLMSFYVENYMHTKLLQYFLIV